MRLESNVVYNLAHAAQLAILKTLTKQPPNCFVLVVDKHGKVIQLQGTNGSQDRLIYALSMARATVNIRTSLTITIVTNDNPPYGGAAVPIFDGQEVVGALAIVAMGITDQEVESIAITAVEINSQFTIT